MRCTRLYKSEHNADSGCLGASCRRRTYMVAIIAGKEPRSRDPAVSEWRNPASFIAGYSVAKIPTCRDITAVEGTVQTETSK